MLLSKIKAVEKMRVWKEHLNKSKVKSKNAKLKLKNQNLLKWRFSPIPKNISTKIRVIEVKIDIIVPTNPIGEKDIS